MSEVQINMHRERPKDSVGEDLRQSYVIMKYEFRKFLEGKKIVMYGILMAFILGLQIALPYLLGDGLGNDATEFAASFTTMVQFMVLISATLFASSAIVSEYEDRTGLLLFTKPVRKRSIFLGKVAAAFVLGVIFISVYYAVTAIVSLAIAGSIATGLITSFGLSLLYVFATTGVAVMISSMVKRSSTAAILTFVLLLMIFTIITSVLTMNSIDAWFMLDDAASYIADSIVSDNGWTKSALAMGIWGTVTGIVGYALFRKREF